MSTEVDVIAEAQILTSTWRRRALEIVYGAGARETPVGAAWIRDGAPAAYKRHTNIPQPDYALLDRVYELVAKLDERKL